MSYIRSTSNPDGLYVYGDIDGSVHFHWSIEEPLSSGRERPLMVPQDIFDRALKAWTDSFGENVDVDGFTIAESHVFVDSGQPVPDGYHVLQEGAQPSAFLIKLAYKGAFVHVWLVTWGYVAANWQARQQKGLG